MRTHFLVGALTTALLVAAVAPPAIAQSQSTQPETIIQNQIDTLMTILSDSTLTQPKNRQQLEKRLIREFEPLFVFREMTRRALGVHARSLSKQQIDELTVVFKRLLEEIYVTRLTSHLSTKGDTAEIESIKITGTTRRGPYAKVKSIATFRKGPERTTFKLNYKMVNRGQGWHIYDVEIEGISLIANYRSQFSNILTNNSYEALLSQLKKKLDKQNSGKPSTGSDTSASPPGLDILSQ